MKKDRREFLNTALTGAVGAGILGCTTSVSVEAGQSDDIANTYAKLDKVLATPVLKTGSISEPVIIENLELLYKDRNFICRVTAKSGAVGLCISNNMQMISLYPIFVNRLQAFFIGKDARNLESLLEEVYVHKSNYKVQNLALWVPLATIEFAILDLLGKIANQSMGELLGGVHNTEISVYRANNYRGKTAEESLERIIQNVEESGAKALKFKIGGRMSNNADYPPGRTEALIPLVREHFGSDMTIYADSNGSYTADKAIEIGKILEEYKIDFYEEPVPFDWYEETKQVADAVNVPIAGGEQEPSMHQFRWLIANNALDIVQPDIFYFGGMIRSMKVAIMAESMGKVCVPHISGSGLGYLYMMHFVSAVSNAGPYHEFKGFNKSIPFNCDTSDFVVRNSAIKVPTGPGSGLEIDPDFVNSHTPVTVY
ncbi:MAG: mandelate racemase/muconate lactonizing enzyme family protein [Cyclobacteriaceae bacterium]